MNDDTRLILERLDKLDERMEALESSDRLQTQSLKLTRRIQLGCLVALCTGAALGLGVIKAEVNREAAERLAIALLSASAAGLVGAEFVDKVRG